MLGCAKLGFSCPDLFNCAKLVKLHSRMSKRKEQGERTQRQAFPELPRPKKPNRASLLLPLVVLLLRLHRPTLSSPLPLQPPRPLLLHMQHVKWQHVKQPLHLLRWLPLPQLRSSRRCPDMRLLHPLHLLQFQHRSQRCPPGAGPSPASSTLHRPRLRKLCERRLSLWWLGPA